jgi:flagellar FliL protein
VTVTAMPQTETGATPKKSRRMLIIGIVAVLAILGGGAYFFVLKPSGPTTPKPGVVLPLDSIQINLAGGHYLRLGIALQETTTAGEDIDGSKALDAAIELFSGQSMTALNQGQPREALKAKLSHELTGLYDGQVMGVYFTEFVTQ